MDSVIIKYPSLDTFLEKLNTNEEIIENWKKENPNFEVFCNSYVGEKGELMIQTIITKT